MTNKQLLTLVACCIGSSLFSVFLYATLFPRNTNQLDPLAKPFPRTMVEKGGQSPGVDFSVTAARTTPSVVYIRSFSKRSSRWERGGISNSGSGVIIAPDGYIATNNHVIAGADRIKVMLDNQSEYEAEVIGVDQTTDLALLRIKETELPYLQFGDSDSLRVGEWVLAGGNPFNLESTVTVGIVSAKGRSIDVLEGEDRIESFIQTDASVNPGNSGGALVNDRGELIGIVTAILTTSGKHEGYAFAIPGNLARRILKDLRDFGEVERAVLGVYVQKINAAQAKRLKLPEAIGTLITGIREGGSAAASGLQENDVIRAINDLEVGSPAELQEAMSQFRPGDEVEVTFVRGGRTQRLSLTLFDKEGLTKHKRLVSQPDLSLLRTIGIAVREVKPTERRSLGAVNDDGLRVISVFRASIAAAINLEAGYLITEIDGVAVSSIAGLLSYLPPGAEVELKGYYDHLSDPYYYNFTVPE